MARNILQEYQNWFDTTDPGTTIDWSGGKLKRTPGGANYTWGQDNSLALNPRAGLQDLYGYAQQAPGIASHWNETYGNNWYTPPSTSTGNSASGGLTGNTQTASSPPSVSGIIGNSGATGGGSTGSAITPGIQLPSVDDMEGPQSWAGIDPAFMNNLTGWMNNLSDIMNPQSYQDYMGSAFNPAIGEAGGYWDEASQGLGQLYQDTLRPLLQQEMNSLAGRNMVDGTVASEGLAGAANKADTAILDRAQQINTAKAGALSNILSQRAAASAAYPDALGNLAQLTRASGSTNDAYKYAVFGDLMQALLPFLQPEGGGLTSNEIGQGGGGPSGTVGSSTPDMKSTGGGSGGSGSSGSSDEASDDNPESGSTGGGNSSSGTTPATTPTGTSQPDPGMKELMEGLGMVWGQDRYGRWTWVRPQNWVNPNIGAR